MEAPQKAGTLDLYPLRLLLGSHYWHIFLLQTKMIKSNTTEIRGIKRKSASRAFGHEPLSKQSALNPIKTWLFSR